MLLARSGEETSVLVRREARECFADRDVPLPAKRLVRDWIAQRSVELAANWARTRMAGEWDYARVKQRPGPMAAPLKDEDYIARAFLDDGAPTWPNGWDVSPEALYADLKAAGALKRSVAAE